MTAVFWYHASQDCSTPEVSLYKLLDGGSAGCKAVLPVGVRLRRRCAPAPDAIPAEEGDRGDLEGRGVVYEVEGWSWSSFFLKSNGVKYDVSLELCMGPPCRDPLAGRTRSQSPLLLLLLLLPFLDACCAVRQRNFDSGRCNWSPSNEYNFPQFASLQSLVQTITIGRVAALI